MLLFEAAANGTVKEVDRLYNANYKDRVSVMSCLICRNKVIILHKLCKIFT